jgi:hypothetical protein
VAQIAAPVTLVNVDSAEDAERLRFVGSPSLRVDGQDVDPDAPIEGFNLECRLYCVGGRAVGSPPQEWIERAVLEAAR